MNKEEEKTGHYLPKYEYKTHINIYSKSSKALGRQLCNYYRSEFTHPEYGTFMSVEGFYYWVLTGKKHDNLKSLHGTNAHQQGISYEKVISENDDTFKREVCAAIILKIEQNDRIKSLFKESSLPLTSYSYYGDVNDNPKVQVMDYKQYIIDVLEQYRYALQNQE